MIIIPKPRTTGEKNFLYEEFKDVISSGILMGHISGALKEGTSGAVIKGVFLEVQDRVKKSRTDDEALRSFHLWQAAVDSEGSESKNLRKHI